MKDMPADTIDILRELINDLRSEIRDVRDSGERTTKTINDLAVSLARIEAGIKTNGCPGTCIGLAKQVEELRKDVGDLQTSRAESLGGWKMLGIVATVAGTVGSAATWAIQNIRLAP